LIPFLTLNVANDGLFYGVDNDSNNKRRFTLLNNFVLKLPNQENYEITLRNSYNVPNNKFAWRSILVGRNTK